MSEQTRAIREATRRLHAQLDGLEQARQGLVPHPVGEILRAMQRQIESLEDEMAEVRRRLECAGRQPVRVDAVSSVRVA